MKMNNCDDIEIPEFCGDSDNVSYGNGEWTNHTAKPLKNIRCLINYDIVERVRDFEYCVNKKLGGSNEFGGYIKWHWNNGDIVVDDFMIPEQVVGGATVDFRSDAAPGYSGVFHKHPNGCKSFSGVDDRYINSNHDLSLLFEGGTFIMGIVNIDLPGNMRFQTHVQIVIQKHESRNEVNVDMITNRSSAIGFQKSRNPFQEVVKRPAFDIPNFEKDFKPIINPTSFIDNEDEIDDSDDSIPTIGF